MKISADKMKELVAESVFSIQSEDVKKYHSKNMPVDLKPLSSLKEKQISNAISSFASGCSREDIVAFCDGTFTGSGKKGLLFSTDGFYSSDLNILRKKLPLSLPIRYEELQSVSAKDNEIYFHFTNGQVANGFGSIYTGFIVEALSRIIQKMSVENVENIQQISQKETLFGCIWCTAQKNGSSLFFLDFSENRRYMIHNHIFSDKTMHDMQRLVYFALAERDDSTSYPKVTNRLPDRYLYLEMKPDEFTDSQFVFSDCSNKQKKYVIHKDFFRLSKDSLKLLENGIVSENSRQVVLYASNYAGSNTAILESVTKFSPVNFEYDQNKILISKSDVASTEFCCLWKNSEDQITLLEISTGKTYHISLMGLLSQKDLENMGDQIIFALTGRNINNEIIRIFPYNTQKIGHLKCQSKGSSESTLVYETGGKIQTYIINRSSLSPSEYRKISKGDYFHLICNDRSSRYPLSLVQE
ncbi:MAG TPA: hypothetical protein IAA08_05625 [Candidatus Eubacterium avistercoris]|uniref:Uncharacterized protein n=1 Tax=Candidatus Eubacterium avistercoris TaxID=2838567 RepID=A0A9D2D2F9_9FIRM|nr:hypothetical protein [Candidatus Eubacterium avistercoris]